MNADANPPPDLGPEWWTAPDLRPSLAVRDIGALFWWLNRRGWSQTMIGARTGQSQPEVSAIMHGRQVQAYSVVVGVADGLGIPRGYFGLSHCVECSGSAGGEPQGEDGEGDDPVRRREFVRAAAVVAAGGSVAGLDSLLPARVPSAAAVPARVGASEVTQVRAVTGQFRAMGYRYGYGAVLDAAHGYAGWARGMLRSRAGEEIRRDLQIALGELHALIGWMHHDSGNTLGVRQNCLQTLALARDADEPELVAGTLGGLAEAAVRRRQATDGLRLARTGQAAATDRVSPATTAWLRVCEAQAWAQIGDEHGVREALAWAEDDLSRADPATVPAWAADGRYLLSGGALAGYRIQVYGALSRHPEHRRYAETAAESGASAFAGSDADRAWIAVVINRVALAAALLRAGARDQGLATAHRAIDEVVALRSRRASDCLTDIADAAGDYPGHGDAEDLRAKLAAAG